MKLKVKNKQVISVQDWDEFVSHTYGRPYNLQQQNGCMSRGTIEIEVTGEEFDEFENDTIPEIVTISAEIVNGKEMGVSFKAWLERDPKQPLKDQEFDFELSLWWKRNFYPSLETVANDLCKRGLLKPGEYIINIDW